MSDFAAKGVYFTFEYLSPSHQDLKFIAIFDYQTNSRVCSLANNKCMIGNLPASVTKIYTANFKVSDKAQPQRLEMNVKIHSNRGISNSTKTAEWKFNIRIMACSNLLTCGDCTAKKLNSQCGWCPSSRKCVENSPESLSSCPSLMVEDCKNCYLDSSIIEGIEIHPFINRKTYLSLKTELKNTPFSKTHQPVDDCSQHFNPKQLEISWNVSAEKVQPSYTASDDKHQIIFPEMSLENSGTTKSKVKINLDSNTPIFNNRSMFSHLTCYIYPRFPSFVPIINGES
eukprot:gb/GECH01009882.1/.p1 GENE.gb/GECH01009882.1/~~gb/GECH01009882.1/.p1  ORF type:complete len:285 (+),score=44.09 gb/GECH01009882.1/:1-855(+)